MIDIAISAAERRSRKLKRWGLAGAAGLVVVLAAVFILRLAPAGPSVSKANLWIATVKKGPFSVTVSAPGTLVPRKIRLVTAGAPGTIQEVRVEPGDRVTTTSILAILSNPDLGDQVIEAGARLADAQASLISQEATLDDRLLTLEDTLSQVESEAQAAGLKAQAEKGLLAEQVVESLQYTRSRLTAASLAREVSLTRQRIADFRENQAAQIHAQRAQIDSLQAAYRSEEHELASLKVRAGRSGLAGVVQSVAVQEGQRVVLGSGIAKIAGMHALKARLEVPASEAAEVALGQPVELPLIYRGGIPRSTRRERVRAILDEMGMSHRLRHYPGQLSGGQQQRVAIARALVGEPSILLADEPTGNLDSKSGEAVMELLAALHERGATLFMVTHDPRYAQFADRLIRLIDGQIVDDVDVREGIHEGGLVTP